MNEELKKFRTRWMRWLGQKTRIDRCCWTDLLNSNWIGWANDTLESHDKGLNIPKVTSGGMKFHYTKAIQCATMRELMKLDNLYATEKIR